MIFLNYFINSKAAYSEKELAVLRDRLRTNRHAALHYVLER